MTTKIVPQEPNNLPTEPRQLTAGDVRAQANLVQEVMQSVMKSETHYGMIPGTDKPTLFKAGSEVILSTFRIAVDPQIEDLSTDDEIRYRIKAVGTHQTTGIIVGYGIGECSTNEEKYKWKACYIQKEFDATPENRRRIKYAQYQNGPVKEKMQIRTSPADLANTVLKMAKKRAQIDLTLTATAASDLFTQDIEDLPDDYVPMEERVSAAHTEKPSLPPMPDEDLSNILTKQAAFVQEGKTTPGKIIAKLATKYTLTPVQVASINDLSV